MGHFVSLSPQWLVALTNHEALKLSSET